MKRYNFDKIPIMASGFDVHTETKKQAWSKAYRLAKIHRYKGKLKFRDNIKCPQNDNNRGYRCRECYP